MKRQSYYPSRVAEQILWLENFRNKLPGYATALSLTAAQIAAIVADCRWLIYVLGSWLPGTRSFAQACTDAATAAMTGSGTGPLVLTVYNTVALPAGVVPVAPGALDRIFAFIALIKPGCDEATSTDLQIVGVQQAGPDLTTIQAVLSTKLLNDGVFIGWGWQGYSAFLDQLEIEVDRADGKGWVMLTFDTTPNYTDTTAFPTTLTKWKYRAIYRLDDHRVGVWSEEVSVNVGG